MSARPRMPPYCLDPAEETFIYFLRAGQFVKIGQSKAWKDRLAQMQTGSPYTILPLLILKAHPSTERKLHVRFRADHFRGEWFHVGAAVQEFIRANRAQCMAKADMDDLRPQEPPPPFNLADDL